MPVPAPRDPGAARDILTGWLGDPARLPGARITDLQTPEFTGFSSEILMVESSTCSRLWGMVDAVGRFDYDGHTGYGLYEYWALGDHPSFR
jgi:hypothetical protein